MFIRFNSLFLAFLELYDWKILILSFIDLAEIYCVLQVLMCCTNLDFFYNVSTLVPHRMGLGKYDAINVRL